MAVEQFGYTQQLHRALSTRDLLVYGMIFMVPIAPWSVFGFVLQDARGMVPMAYLLGLTGMLFTALSYATMSRAFPLAGSVYTYAARALGEAAGFFSGWLILLDYIVIPALLYLLAGIALRPILPQVPQWAWVVGFVCVNAAVNLAGIRLTAQVNGILLWIELIVLGWFLVAGVLALHAGMGAGGLTLRPLYDPQVFSLATVAAATSTAVLSFLGFDAISTLSEESRGGRDAVARATVLSLVLIGGLFMLQTWVAVDLSHGMRFSSPETAFFEIALGAGGPSLRLATIVVTVLATAIANAMAAQAAVARILFAMARDGKLPAVLARVHPRSGTPHMSTLVVAGVSLAVGLGFSSRVDDLSRVVNFGALTSFVLLHLAVIRHGFLGGAQSRSWWRQLASPLLGLAIILYVLYEMDALAKTIGACWVGLGALYYLFLGRRGHKPLALEA